MEVVDILGRLTATLAASSPSELAEAWVMRAAPRLPIRALHVALRGNEETHYYSSPGAPPPIDGWQLVEEATASGQTTVVPGDSSRAPAEARVVVPLAPEPGAAGALIAECAPAMAPEVVGALEALRWPLGLRLARLQEAASPAAQAVTSLATHDLCEGLHRCESLTELCALLLGALPQLLQADWAALVMCDPQGRLMHVTSLDGPAPVANEKWARVAALGAANADGPTLVAASVSPGHSAPEACVWALPLRTEQSPLHHVLAIGGVGAAMSPSSVATLALVGAHARASLARVVAAGALRLALDAHDRVLRITQVLTAMKQGESPDEMLDAVMETILRETPGTVAAVLHTWTGEALVHEASAGIVPSGMCSGAGLRWWQGCMAAAVAAGEVQYRPHPSEGRDATLVTLPISGRPTGDAERTPVAVVSLFVSTVDAIDLVLRATAGPFSQVIAQLAHNLRHYHALERANRELEQRKEQIIESKSALEAILEGFPDGLFIVDRDLRVTLSNDVQALRMRGSGPAAGQYCWELFGSDSGVCPGCRVMDTLKKGVSTRRRMRVHSPGLPEREWEVATHPIARRSARSTRAALVVVRDVTEQQQIAQSLAQVEKMAAVGRLATGIAHEINNPLAAIQANVQLLLEGADPADDQYESLTIVGRSTERARRVVRNLLSFTGQSLDDVTPVDVNAGIRSALELAAGQARRGGVTIACHLAEGLPQVMASPEQLESVWLNLALNALDSLLETGVPGRIDVTSEVAPPDKVCVTFRDNGPGIAARRLPHVFEPFGSNTSPTVGTGLGLFSCHGIIARHGGTIRAQVTEGGGSHFKVLLPALLNGDAEADDAPSTGAA